MGRKTLALGLTCLLLIILPCCKKTPTSPDIEEVLNPVINSFTVSPSSINLGESSTLSWSTENATTVTINQEVVSTSGERNVSPEETTTYVLTAKNSAGETQQSCTVEIVNRAMFILQEHRRTYSYALNSAGMSMVF